MQHLPEKTIERLSKYRRTLTELMSEGKTYVFSRELAVMLHLTPVQVRRDIMLIGYAGSHAKGYEINKMITLIGAIIDSISGHRVAIVGLGNLGKAITRYLNDKKSNMKIIAAFDVAEGKVGKTVDGVLCYHMKEIEDVIRKEHITIGIITVPKDQANEVAQRLVNAGIKGVLNYTPKSISVPPDVFLEEYDMVTSLEKVAYFSKQ